MSRPEIKYFSENSAFISIFLDYLSHFYFLLFIFKNSPPHIIQAFPTVKISFRPSKNRTFKTFVRPTSTEKSCMHYSASLFPLIIVDNVLLAHVKNPI